MKNLIILIFVYELIINVKCQQYKPTWESLDSRPLPLWYDEAKVGIFIHWSTWSVPAAGFDESAYLWLYWKSNSSEAVNYMKKFYSENFEYPNFAPSFKAEFYNASEWLEIFKSSGAKYIVFVSKHHEGYCMWPSKYSFNWNSLDVGPKRDLLGELVEETRTKSDLKIGTYYSLYEWFNSLYVNDKESGFKSNTYVMNKILPELKQLVINYKPDVIWSDGDWEAFPEYWNSTEFLAWLYNESPVKDNVVVNDRWGIGTLCKHGGFLTCSDKYNPKYLINRKWENAMTLDYGSWGYRHNMKLENIISIEDLIKQLIETVSCGGNILINVGPTSEGTIPLIFQERLIQLGEWLQTNGDAIYGSKPWKIQTDPLHENFIWYTFKPGISTDPNTLYALCVIWPSLMTDKLGELVLQPLIPCSSVVEISILGIDKSYKRETKLAWRCDKTIPDLLFIIFNDFSNSDIKSKWAWVIKLSINKF